MAAAGAAAAAAARAQQEEEEMTPYTPSDLAENWEFKILRSITSKFRDPVWLRQILEEEARAGWTLVEKFDDSRIRLKRPASARRNDATLDFDPHRSWVGISQGRFAVLLVAGILAASGVIAVAVVVLVRAAAPH
jgi:hypothetical protein